jgi:putative transposase
MELLFMNAQKSRAGVPADLDMKRRGVLRRFEKGLAVRDCARLAGCSYETARKWVRAAELIGFEEALRPRTSPKIWSVELKSQIVSEYLAGVQPRELMLTYRLPHSNYPGLWAKKMTVEDLPDQETLATGAWERAISARLRGDEQWRVWVTRMREHFFQACAAAPDDGERLRLMNMQADLLEKCFALSSSEKSLTQILVSMVTELKATYPTGQILKAVGVSRSTYYWHLDRAERSDPNEPLKRRLVAAHEANYAAYGYRKMRLLLLQGGDKKAAVVVNHKKIRRLMHELGLRGKSPTKKRYNSFKGGDPEAVNLLNRQFAPESPGKVLVTDITMFTIGVSKLYFSPLIDVFNNQVLSWRLSATPEAAMACGMLQDGLRTLPNNAAPMVHTDQGSQYTSHQWKKTLKEHGAIQSMSRVGNCYDNAPAESFFSRVKTELGRGETAKTAHQFLVQIDRYIQWWNEERIVTRLGTSPLKYLQLQAA